MDLISGMPCFSLTFPESIKYLMLGIMIEVSATLVCNYDQSRTIRKLLEYFHLRFRRESMENKEKIKREADYFYIQLFHHQ